MQSLEGKTAFVTGASTGLGAHFARVLARAGARVTLGARRLEALEDQATALRTEGLHCTVRQFDVTQIESVEDAADDLAADILVNNAGVVREAAALAVTESDWDAVVDTNLKGMFLVAQAAARGMSANGGGSIINIASILGYRQAGGVLPYAVSKAGVIQLTKTLGLELARHNVRVNALAPGYIATELNDEFFASAAGEAMVRRIPQRRLGRLQDLDGPLLLLASDASAYMTGSVITVDGGHLLSSL